jgi:hypothetical protein
VAVDAEILESCTDRRRNDAAGQRSQHFIKCHNVHPTRSDSAHPAGPQPGGAVREQVARALFNKGVTLGQLDRSMEAIAVYDDVVARFADDQSPLVQEIVSTCSARRSEDAQPTE